MNFSLRNQMLAFASSALVSTALVGTAQASSDDSRPQPYFGIFNTMPGATPWRFGVSLVLRQQL
jgi:hypothetical protein